MAYPVGDPFGTAIRSGVAITYTVDASVGGVPVAGATGLRPVGGSITDTSKPGVRRVLNLSLPPQDGLYDALAPYGTTLTVTAHVQYTNRTTAQIPMGVFDVDRQSLAVDTGGISLTAPDKWVRIMRSRFLKPQASQRTRLVTEEIAALIRGALGESEPVSISATSTAAVGSLVYEKDRDKAINDLAETIGAMVYFDRNGGAVIADIPTVGSSADWLIDASANGVLIDLDRQRSRESTRNIVVVESSAADGAKFPTTYVWDNDPTSPTYAGTGAGWGTTPPTDPGPFGLVPYYHDTPVLTTLDQARNAGWTILARTTGLASSVSLSQVPNPAVDAFDTLDVLPPGREPTGVTWVGAGTSAGEGFGTGPFGTMPFGGGSGGGSTQGTPVVSYRATGVLERHVADTVTHPLVLGSAQQIEGRSTRSDIYAEGG